MLPARSGSRKFSKLPLSFVQIPEAEWDCGKARPCSAAEGARSVQLVDTAALDRLLISLTACFICFQCQIGYSLTD